MTELNIRTVRDGDVCTVTLQGELDVYTTPQFKAELKSPACHRCKCLVIDLDGLTFMDSSGLGAMIGALHRSRSHDGTVRIVCKQEGILRLFHITRLDETFAIFSDTATAAKC